MKGTIISPIFFLWHSSLFLCFRSIDLVHRTCGLFCFISFSMSSSSIREMQYLGKHGPHTCAPPEAAPAPRGKLWQPSAPSPPLSVWMALNFAQPNILTMYEGPQTRFSRGENRARGAAGRGERSERAEELPRKSKRGDICLNIVTNAVQERGARCVGKWAEVCLS